jgi:hypothetical protein
MVTMTCYIYMLLVLQEISKLYRLALSEEDRDYYVQFARDANKEYQLQLVEFRATGSYRPSPHFYKFKNANVWVRTDVPNPLEKEIIKYEQEEEQQDGIEDGDEDNDDSNECNDNHETENNVPHAEEGEYEVKPKRQKHGDEETIS